MRCVACGVNCAPQAIYCHRCGERLDVSPQDARPRERPAVAAAAQGFGAAAEISDLTSKDVRDPPEGELWRGGYSPKAMLGVWTACAVLSLGTLIAGILWARTWEWWLVLLGLMALPWLYGLTVLGYRRMSVSYLLTTQRFFHESGILRRVTDRVEAIDMDDITFEQGLVERLTGVGTIRIVSSDRTHPELLLRGIENVRQVAEAIDDARRAERRRRGLHIEQI